VKQKKQKRNEGIEGKKKNEKIEERRAREGEDSGRGLRDAGRARS